MTQDKVAVTGRTRDLVITLDKMIFQMAKHWLLLANLAVAIFVGLPLLAPLLMSLGYTSAANIIYVVYRSTCHQLPYRSFFLFGPHGLAAYSVETILAQNPLPANIQDFVGNAALGYKVGICQRDIAIYGTILLSGLVYGLVRRHRRVPPLPFIAYVLIGLVPLGIDGLTQLTGLRESTWELRLLTGFLFGLATTWLAYPYLDDAMREIRETVNAKLHLE
jgi:uncharacterized membrane protein